MDEVVVSGEQVMEVETKEAEKSEESDKMEKEEEDGGSKEVVRWESYLPRMALTVLLVEADDSTRQIIAALLRKCNYKGQLCPFIVYLLHSFYFDFIFFLGFCYLVFFKIYVKVSACFWVAIRFFLRILLCSTVVCSV